jgi:hypothetical protein
VGVKDFSAPNLRRGGINLLIPRANGEERKEGRQGSIYILLNIIKLPVKHSFYLLGPMSHERLAFCKPEQRVSYSPQTKSIKINLMNFQDFKP